MKKSDFISDIIFNHGLNNNFYRHMLCFCTRDIYEKRNSLTHLLLHCYSYNICVNYNVESCHIFLFHTTNNYGKHKICYEPYVALSKSILNIRANRNKNVLCRIYCHTLHIYIFLPCCLCQYLLCFLCYSLIARRIDRLVYFLLYYHRYCYHRYLQWMSHRTGKSLRCWRYCYYSNLC